MYDFLFPATLSYAHNILVVHDTKTPGWNP